MSIGKATGTMTQSVDVSLINTSNFLLTFRYFSGMLTNPIQYDLPKQRVTE